MTGDVADRRESFAALQRFCGSPTRYRHGGLLLTPGALFVAETFAAWWFIDLVSAAQLEAPATKMPFQVWTLKCSKTKWRAIVTCADGDFDIRMRRRIYTDFPHPGVVMWLDDLVLHLPNEH